MVALIPRITLVRTVTPIVTLITPLTLIPTVPPALPLGPSIIARIIACLAAPLLGRLLLIPELGGFPRTKAPHHSPNKRRSRVELLPLTSLVACDAANERSANGRCETVLLVPRP